MSINRRELLKAGALGVGGAAVLNAGLRTSAAGSPPYEYRWEKTYSGGPEKPSLEPGLPGKHYRPVVVPGGVKLPWKIVDGVKVFHLIAEEVEHEFAPGLKARCWGYNGTVNGPVIEAVEGDRIRIYVTNKTIAPTAVHWHGVFFPCGQDGVGGLTQKNIQPGRDVQVRAGRGNSTAPTCSTRTTTR
jgi:manganese oxidase